MNPSTPSHSPHPQVLPKREGLLHVSEWGPSRINNIADVVKEGDTVDVMITEIQVSLSLLCLCSWFPLETTLRMLSRRAILWT